MLPNRFRALAGILSAAVPRRSPLRLRRIRRPSCGATGSFCRSGAAAVWRSFFQKMNAAMVVWANALVCSGLRNGPFGLAKRAVWGCKTAHVAVRNVPYCCLGGAVGMRAPCRRSLGSGRNPVVRCFFGPAIYGGRMRRGLACAICRGVECCVSSVLK